MTSAVLAYLITLVSLMMVAGRVADMWGKKVLYCSGFLIFTVGSLLCGLAPSVGLLVGARVFQGLGAALLMALGGAIATEAFPPQERGRAMGIIGLLVSVGLVSGPTLGGLILGAFTWHSIFLVNLPLGVLGLIMAWRVIPTRPRPAREPFDWLGAIWLSVALLGLTLAVTLGPGGEVAWPVLVVLAALATFSARAFISREQRFSHPLLDLGLFKNRVFTVQIVTGSMTFVAAAGLVLLLPFYLQDLQGRSPQQAGTLLIVSPLSMGIAAPIAGRLSDRIGTRPLTIIGLTLVFLGYIFASTLKLDTNATGYILRVTWIGLGMGIFQSPNNSAILGAVPRTRLGVASGLLSLSRTLGQTTGIAVLGALWAALVHWLEPSFLADATHATATVQLEALCWVARACALLMFAALLLVVQGTKGGSAQHTRQSS